MTPTKNPPINGDELSDRPALPFGEFVALMAMMISLVALSIDAMLPALAEIGRDLGLQRDNDRQLIISLLFGGMAIGQMLYGPLSDSTGRKPVIYAGYVLFIIGCLLSICATRFSMMLTGRLLQGIGAAGPRSVVVAVIRDQYHGRAMARVMSLIMSVFILIPVIAPTFGQGILAISHWRGIFGAFLVLAVIAFVWFGKRQPETLLPNRRLRFSVKRIAVTVGQVCTHRVAVGYTIAAGLISGAFLGYLSCSQQILQEQYGLGTRFPLFFAVLAAAIGSASYLNSHLVMRYGMQRLVRWSSQALSGLAIVFFAIAYALSGNPPLWMLMTFFLSSFFCVGILFGNLNSLAMEPLGHIAGVGATVVGSLSTFLSVPLGTLIGQGYNGTILPLVGGFALLSPLAVIAVRLAGGRKSLEES